MEKTHNDLMQNKMGMEPGLSRKSRIDIDESKIFTFEITIKQMFCLIDRGNYDIHIFFVNDNRTKETLLPIIKNNVLTPFPSIIYNKRCRH